MSTVEQRFTGYISNEGLWAFATVAFAILHYTGEQKPLDIRLEGMRKYIALTMTWFIFTCWFLGWPILERVFHVLGAQCALSFPDGASIDVSLNLCLKQTVITYSTHPDLFRIPLRPLEDGTHVAWFTDRRVTVPHNWASKAHLSYNAHISAQIFTVAMFGSFILDQVRHSLQGHIWTLSSRAHKGAVFSSLVLVTVLLVACCTAAVQSSDQAVFESAISFALGVASFAFTLLPMFRISSAEVNIWSEVGNHATKA